MKSTALLFGDHVMAAVACFAIGFVALLTYAGISNHQGPAFYTVSIAGVALHLVWQLFTVDLDSPASCWRKWFKALVATQQVLSHHHFK